MCVHIRTRSGRHISIVPVNVVITTAYAEGSLVKNASFLCACSVHAVCMQWGHSCWKVVKGIQFTVIAV